MCTNGYLEFVGPASTTCASGNVAIPTAARPNGAIFGYWDALVVDSQASIRSEAKADGNLIDIYSGVTSNRGVYELPNGNILTTNGSGVHEIDRADGLVETKISGVSSHQITRVDLDHCVAP